jgi:hypothetical protein
VAVLYDDDKEEREREMKKRRLRNERQKSLHKSACKRRRRRGRRRTRRRRRRRWLISERVSFVPKSVLNVNKGEKGRSNGAVDLMVQVECRDKKGAASDFLYFEQSKSRTRTNRFFFFLFGKSRTF